MRNTRLALAAGVAAALALLSGCMTGDPIPGGPVSAAPSGVDGEWIGTDGVAVSTLQAGRFSSRSLNTGELLTEGTYKHRDQRTIDLSFFSIRTQQNTLASCLLVNPDQMNCTLSSGNRFVLNRRPAVS